MGEVQGGYYGFLPSYIMEVDHKILNGTDKTVYAKIAALTSSKGYCWANNKTLAKGCGIEPASVTRSIGKLIEQGFIGRKIIRDENKQIINRYLVLKQPELSDDAPNNDDPKGEIEPPTDNNVGTPTNKNDDRGTTKNVETPINKNVEERLKVLDTTTTRALKENHPLAYYQIAFGQSASGLLNAKISQLADMYGYELVNYSFYLAASDGKGYQYAKKGLLDNWLKDGLKTIADVDRSRAAYKAKQATKKQTRSNNRNGGYQQSSGNPIKTHEASFDDQLYNTYLNNERDVNRTIKQYQLDHIDVTAEQIRRVYRERT